MITFQVTCEQVGIECAVKSLTAIATQRAYVVLCW